MAERLPMSFVVKAVAPGLYLLRSFPPHGINAYLADGVLIDAGTRLHRWPILRQLRGHTVIAHVLTHGHPDHQGASHAVCEARGLPLWCGAGDARAVERGATVELLPASAVNRALNALLAGPAHRVARVLREGDSVGPWTVIETPGHTPGHIALWRERDGVLLLGVVLANNHPITQQPGLREPAARYTLDAARNRRSARALAGLQPRLICFGHGPPLRDTPRFHAFVEGLGVGVRG